MKILVGDSAPSLFPFAAVLGSRRGRWQIYSILRAADLKSRAVRASQQVRQTRIPTRQVADLFNGCVAGLKSRAVDASQQMRQLQIPTRQAADLFNLCTADLKLRAIRACQQVRQTRIPTRQMVDLFNHCTADVKERAARASKQVRELLARCAEAAAPQFALLLPALEPLERRTFLSAVTLSNGVLHLSGDATGFNSLTVDLQGNGQLLANADGHKFELEPSAVQSISITGGGGPDWVYINPLIKVDANFSPGDGNDTIWGGTGADTITAGNGNDLVYASGNITLGDGDNVVWAKRDFQQHHRRQWEHPPDRGPG